MFERLTHGSKKMLNVNMILWDICSSVAISKHMLILGKSFATRASFRRIVSISYPNR